MKLVTYDLGKARRAGLAAEGMIVDLEKSAKAVLDEKLPNDTKELLDAGAKAMKLARRLAKKVAAVAKAVDKGKERRPAWMYPEDRVHLQAPITNPEKVVCMGLNYLDHIKEQEGRLHKAIDPPENPIIFSKFPSSLTGPYDPIQLPPEAVTKQVDFEVELALVISKLTRNVSEAEAMDCVAGYMVFNDVSARDCQFADKQWVRAKSFDGFAPCGPWLVTPDEIENPHKLRLWTTVNGQTMQDSSTKNLIFQIPRIIAYLSRSLTFKPGDIISTGTPAGVGIFRDPSVVLKPGDVVECGIEGIGVICNTCEQL